MGRAGTSVGVAVEAAGVVAPRRRAVGRGCVAAPGQRLTWPVCRPPRRWLGAFGVSVPPGGLSANWKALKIGWMRA